MVDYLAMLVALICLGAILSKHIPTGVLGSAGMLAIGVASLVAIDDASFANVERLDAIVLVFMLGFLALVAHVAFMMYRSRTGNATPRRRSTDWGKLDNETTIVTPE